MRLRGKKAPNNVSQKGYRTEGDNIQKKKMKYGDSDSDVQEEELSERGSSDVSQGELSSESSMEAVPAMSGKKRDVKANRKNRKTSESKEEFAPNDVMTRGKRVKQAKPLPRRE